MSAAFTPQQTDREAYDRDGFRDFGHGQTHARTELRHNDRCFSTSGTGPEVRAMLRDHAEGRE